MNLLNPFFLLTAATFLLAAWQARRPRKRGPAKPRVICAWCEPGPYPPGISHGICDRHREEMLAEVARKSGELPSTKTINIRELRKDFTVQRTSLRPAHFNLHYKMTITTLEACQVLQKKYPGIYVSATETRCKTPATRSLDDSFDVLFFVNVDGKNFYGDSFEEAIGNVTTPTPADKAEELRRRAGELLQQADALCPPAPKLLCPEGNPGDLDANDLLEDGR